MHQAHSPRLVTALTPHFIQALHLLLALFSRFNPMHATSIFSACRSGFPALLLWLCVGVSGCATSVSPLAAIQAQLPLQRGWYEGQAVFYVTTDVSDAAMAQAKGANYAPRLAFALPDPAVAAKPSSLDKVYAVTNFEQGGVFASAPQPMGYLNQESAYSPLWRMVAVTWKAGAAPRVLKSEEAVLDAAEKGWVSLETTRVVLNCPIVKVIS